MKGHPDQILGRLIQQRREHLGIKRSELGQAIGRNGKYIEHVEKRGTIISPIYLKPLAQCLRLPVDCLLDPQIPIPNNAPIPQPNRARSLD